MKVKTARNLEDVKIKVARAAFEKEPVAVVLELSPIKGGNPSSQVYFVDEALADYASLTHGWVHAHSENIPGKAICILAPGNEGDAVRQKLFSLNWQTKQ